MQYMRDKYCLFTICLYSNSNMILFCASIDTVLICMGGNVEQNKGWKNNIKRKRENVL